MRKSIIIGFLLMLMTLTGCSKLPQPNNTKDTDQPLTQAQINEIITATNDSLIKEIDLSQVTKPDPAHQAEANEKMQRLGEMMKGQVTIENTKVVVARVNEESISAADWYFEKAWQNGKAQNKNQSPPSDEEILNNLKRAKVICSAARNLGLYPPEEQVNAYLADQRKQMEQLQLEEITVLIKSWGISEEEYFLLMKERFTNSLAKANWGTYLEKYGDLQKDDEGYVERGALWVDEAVIMPLLEKAQVEVTSEGHKLGLPLTGSSN